MGEPIWGRVQIKVPADWLWVDEPDRGICIGSDYMDHIDGSPLAEAMYAAASVEEWATDLELEVEVHGDFALIRYAGNFNYGVASEALGALYADNIPFEAHDDPKYEFPGQNFWFDPIRGIAEVREADAESNTTIKGSEILPLIDDTELLLAFLREKLACETFDIKECSIEHLRALPNDAEHDVEGTPMFIIDPKEES